MSKAGESPKVNLIVVTEDQLTEKVSTAVKEGFNAGVEAAKEEQNEELMTSSQVAEMTHCTTVHIKKMEKRGHIKSYWFGGKKLYKRSEIIQLIDDSSR